MTLNEWFMSLPRSHRDNLHSDKWMLAEAAFEAGKAVRDQEVQELKDALFWMQKRMQS